MTDPAAPATNQKPKFTQQQKQRVNDLLELLRDAFRDAREWAVVECTDATTGQPVPVIFVSIGEDGLSATPVARLLLDQSEVVVPGEESAEVEAELPNDETIPVKMSPTRSAGWTPKGWTMKKERAFKDWLLAGKPGIVASSGLADDSPEMRECFDNMLEQLQAEAQQEQELEHHSRGRA